MFDTKFFNNVFKFCEGQIEIRPLPGQPGFFDLNDHAGIDSHCSKHKASNLYFGVGTRDGDGGGKENLINVPALWCDCDFKDSSREIIVEKFKAFPFKPSIIVKSGGGIHFYWLLKEPADKSDIPAIEDINHRIADQLGGDHNACDVARILRIPGSRNSKYNPPRKCEVVQTNDFNYSLDDFIEILPESANKSRPNDFRSNDKNWLSEAMQGVPGGSRNTTGVKIAGYWINKLSPGDVLTILTIWNLNNAPPLPQSDIETIVKSVSRYSNPGIEQKRKLDISNVYDSEVMIEEYREYIKTLKQNRFITGIGEIDKRIRGVAGGEVLTIIARSGSFKTAMLQNLLKNYIQNSSWGAVFFSIEMPIASVAERYLQILDGSSGKEVEDLFSDQSQLPIQNAAVSKFIDDLKRLYVVPTKVSLSDITAYVQLIEREKNIKIGVIGVDYMGLMDGPGTSEYEIITRVCSGLKSTAKLLNIPVIVLSQVNRKGGSGNVEISLDMGRGSGAIEEGADFVLGLWQVQRVVDVIGELEPVLEYDLICRILKNRKGPKGSRWKLSLIPSTLQILPEAESFTSPKDKSSESGY